MGFESMTLEQVATYLQRDVREVSKLANRGYLPGQKVGGEWRFATVEVNHWIEKQMHAYTEAELTALEVAHRQHVEHEEPLVTGLLSESTIGIHLHATTRKSLLRELVHLAEQSWQVYDADAVLDAILQREQMGSTALESGVAIPHPHRPLPSALGDSVIALARLDSGIPYGAPRGALTDLFFLVCCSDHRTHLRVLARLSRLFLRPNFLDDLRAVETPAEARELIETAERELLE
jgi:nitrogen PTS system EIIA component